MSEAQRRYLQKRAIANAELETCCDCPGNDFCKRQSNPCQGFERNCKCDDDMEALRKARGMA